MIGDLIAGLLGKVIDRAWPDPAQKAQIALELEKLRQAGEFKAIDAEIAAMRTVLLKRERSVLAHLKKTSPALLADSRKEAA